ncbi:Unknown protein [Striga hermonthica]|uniref:CCHC-type domain-containing protein n=1 Tax=Striga hermonthica TaxID=68872 RepID=A0A9N7MJ73_STRHE|nr:Unknown protein [Striga hermonthica]
MAEHRRGRPRLHQNYNAAPQHGNANPQPPAQPPTGDNLTAQAITQLMNFLQQHMASNPNAPETHDRALERFLRFNPPTFLGEPDDAKAEYWLERIESIFAMLQYTEAQRLSLATFRLESAVHDWWKNVSEKWTRENKNRTWENFVREFKTQYISQAAREARRDEFYHLKQGSLTVAQYESQFNRLSKYAPGLVSTEEDKLYKFTRGLRHSLQQSLLTVRMNTYAEAVEAATRIESGMARLQQVQNNSGGNFKRPAPGPYSKTPQKFQKPNESKNTPTRKKPSVKNPPPHCSHCSKVGHTSNDCWRKLGKCLRCGSSQHQIKDCPKSGAPADNRTAPEKPGNNRARVPTCVFALAGQEAPEATDVVEGTFLVSNHFARALIDPGSSHSFVAPRFAQKRNVPMDYLSSCFEVSTPMGASQLTDVVYNACGLAKPQSRRRRHLGAGEGDEGTIPRVIWEEFGDQISIRRGECDTPQKPVTKEFVEPRSDIRLAWNCIVHTGASAQYWSFGSN